MSQTLTLTVKQSTLTRDKQECPHLDSWSPANNPACWCKFVTNHSINQCPRFNVFDSVYVCVRLQGVIVRKRRRAYLLCSVQRHNHVPSKTNELHSQAVCTDAVYVCTLCIVHACWVVSNTDMFTEGPHISKGLMPSLWNIQLESVSTCMRAHTHIHTVYACMCWKATEMYLATCYILH